MRRQFWIASLALPLAFGAPTRGTAAPVLVAYLTGDGTTADASGNGNDGVTAGSVGYGTGVFGQAFAFGGASAVNIANAASLNFGTGDFSFTLRYRPTEGSSVTGLISKDSYPVDPSYNGWLANNCPGCGGLGSEVRNILAGQDANLRIASAGLSGGVWYNFTFTRQAGTETAYLDGAAIGSFSETVAIDVSNLAPVTIGALNATSVGSTGIQNFSGLIDDVAIFNGALSAADVAAIYGSGVGSFVAVTEPVSAAMLGLGLLAAGLVRRREPHTPA